MKKVISLILLILLMCSGCAYKSEIKITDSDTAMTTRLENTVELQKNIFISEILSVETKNALITKYNLDITRYTVYTVNITQSIDGYTPVGYAKLYCVGTTDEFMSRINMKKGESYIVDAQPWVYGDEIIYLLSVYTVAYPRIDTAGMVTLAQSADTAVSCGSLTDYIAQYDAARTELSSREPDFFTPQNILARFGTYLEEIKEKNTADAYGGDMEYEWLPDGDFIAKTAEKSNALYTEYQEFAQRGNITTEEVTDFISSVLG